MRIIRPIVLVLAATVFAGLAAGCAAPGSKDSQVASWQRQLKRNPDARTERRSAAKVLEDARREAAMERATAKLTFGLLVALLLGGH